VYDRLKVLDEGMQAGLDDVPVASCPYPGGSSKETWLEGWKCATNDLTLPEVFDAVLDVEKRSFLKSRERDT
jgi:ribosome modulation factor